VYYSTKHKYNEREKPSLQLAVNGGKRTQCLVSN